MRVLMRKKRRHLDQAVITVASDRPENLAPTFHRDRMGRRTDRQNIKKQRFIKVIPTGLAKTRLRAPGKSEGFPIIQHPREIDPFVDLLNQVPDFRVIVIFSRKKSSGKKKRRVNRRKLRSVYPNTCLKIQKMVEEPLVLLGVLKKKLQGPHGERPGRRATHPSPLHRHRINREREPDPRNARRSVRLDPGPVRRAIPNETVLRIVLLREITERFFLDIVQECAVVSRNLFRMNG